MEQETLINKSYRIQYIDGLRGVAILLVLGFHAYSRWPQIFPYGDTYSGFPIFKVGWLGVHLFFIISGFVIFMTLDKSKNLLQFIYKRWLRLFPAMALASFLIYITSPFFCERPAGHPVFFSIIPGITFIQPSWWDFMGVSIVPLEGAFWSLYVEVKFYVVASFIYFFLGRKYLIPFLIGLFMFYHIVNFCADIIGWSTFYFLKNIFKEFSLNYFGWFATGSIFYIYFQTKNRRYFWYGGFIALICSISIKNLEPISVISAIFISILFMLSLRSQLVQSLLKNHLFYFFGIISYPLYLIHENAMVSSIVKLHNYFPSFPYLLLPVIPILLLSMMAFIISKVYEPMAKVVISNLITSFK